jgi:putative tricarboxylic transport membrane protein
LSQSRRNTFSQHFNQLSWYSEFIVVALLAVGSVVVAVDAATMSSGLAQIGPVGPRVVPLLVSGLLAVCAVLLAIDVLRGGSGDIAEGEDIDLGQPGDVRAPVLLVASFLANMVLIDRVGWVISGTVLFWGSVYALGSRNYLRDLGISLILSIVTFYGFYSGLGIALPAGILQGIL